MNQDSFWDRLAMGFVDAVNSAVGLINRVGRTATDLVEKAVNPLRHIPAYRNWEDNRRANALSAVQSEIDLWGEHYLGESYTNFKNFMSENSKYFEAIGYVAAVGGLAGGKPQVYHFFVSQLRIDSNVEYMQLSVRNLFLPTPIGYQLAIPCGT